MEKTIPPQCLECSGQGWTQEHDYSFFSHNANGSCKGNCYAKMPCKKCKGTGVLIL